MKIVFNLDNYTKCLCPTCPVQTDSYCIAKKEQGWREMRKTVGKILMEYPDSPETYDIEAGELEEHDIGRKHGFSKPAAEQMKEIYCSIGKSECSDLNDGQRCICSDCVVWKINHLKKMYFCFQGSSEELG